MDFKILALSLRDSPPRRSLLVATLALKAILNQAFTIQHYKGESSADNIRCPIDDCRDDLIYIILCAFQRCIFNIYMIARRPHLRYVLTFTLVCKARIRRKLRERLMNCILKPKDVHFVAMPTCHHFLV